MFLSVVFDGGLTECIANGSQLQWSVYCQLAHMSRAAWRQVSSDCCQLGTGGHGGLGYNRRMRKILLLIGMGLLNSGLLILASCCPGGVCTV